MKLPCTSGLQSFKTYKAVCCYVLHICLIIQCSEVPQNMFVEFFIINQFIPIEKVLKKSERAEFFWKLWISKKIVTMPTNIVLSCNFCFLSLFNNTSFNKYKWDWKTSHGIMWICSHSRVSPVTLSTRPSALVGFFYKISFNDFIVWIFYLNRMKLNYNSNFWDHMYKWNCVIDRQSLKEALTFLWPCCVWKNGMCIFFILEKKIKMP